MPARCKEQNGSDQKAGVPRGKQKKKEKRRRQKENKKLGSNILPSLTLLLADTDGPTTTTGSLGVLTANTQTPVVTETTVGADPLETLEILTELAVETVGEHLRVLAIVDVALSVQEPGRDLVLGWALNDGDDALEFFGGELTGAVDILLVLMVFLFFFYFSFFADIPSSLFHLFSVCPVIPI